MFFHNKSVFLLSCLIQSCISIQIYCFSIFPAGMIGANGVLIHTFSVAKDFIVSATRWSIGQFTAFFTRQINFIFIPIQIVVTNETKIFNFNFFRKAVHFFTAKLTLDPSSGIKDAFCSIGKKAGLIAKCAEILSPAYKMFRSICGLIAIWTFRIFTIFQHTQLYNRSWCIING